MMVRQLLELPPELLVRILSLLSVQDLLKFAQASRHSRVLANSNVHTLSLGIHLIQPSYLIRRLDLKRYRRIQFNPPASEQSSPFPTSNKNDEELELGPLFDTEETAQIDCDPQMMWVRIPQGHAYDYLALLRFHDALFNSLLHRHGQMLQNLNLCLWTLTMKLARSIADLSALRSLSIKIEANQCARPVPRNYILQERLEQGFAWWVLSRDAVWTHHLRSLKVENADLNHSQLRTLLHSTRTCQELSLRNCQFIGKELWELLSSSAWQGRAALQRLTVSECGSVLGERSVNAIGQLQGLEYLNLQGCVVDSDTMEQWNEPAWDISEILAPRSDTVAEDLIIEVDPDYM